MRVIAQRVASASVMVGEETVGAIDHGLLLLVGVEETDSEVDVNWLSAKLSKLRIFPDAAGVMNRNVSKCWRSASSRFLRRSGREIGRPGAVLRAGMFLNRCLSGLFANSKQTSGSRLKPGSSVPTCG